MNIATISPQQAHALKESGAIMVDIREPDEFLREHIPGAINYPLSSIHKGLPLNINEQQQLIIFNCQSGQRTKNNESSLVIAANSEKIKILDGGINNWKKSGLPVLKNDNQPLPIMRQVHIAAGCLIISSLTLGYSVNTGFFLLAGLVGAGLIIAGITGWCGMAKLLNHMPWNNQNI
ncbi:inner membrane protein YgaP [Salmonella enterica subsp. enterica serovar Choleraesuis]|nr:inner membrane protein YgaP [Salmonella enterica subsp. enterica serovar Choleraesuis]